MKLTKTFRFEASHVLPRHPGKCSRLHGHSWILHVSVEGAIDPTTGFVKDYAEISKVVKPLVERLDHRHLGRWSDLSLSVECADSLFWSEYQRSGVPNLSTNFYPSSENLLIWIGEQLVQLALNWSELSLEETCTSLATLTREEFNNGKTV